MWTKKQLEETIGSQMSDYLLVVVSNRQPYSQVSRAGKIVMQRQPGGLVTALDPVLQAARGTWIAVGTSPYDRATAAENAVAYVPPENPSYKLKRIFLTKEEMDRYYYGYSNESLWPLCHIAYTRPVFEAQDWEAYRNVNRKFADAVLEEVGDQKAFVWVHDYHLTLVGKYLREANRPNIITSFFWHIPWPNPEIFQICPQKKEILEGMLCYDLLGFQIIYHCDNFMATVDRELESRIDRERNVIIYQNRETFVRAFPISVDTAAISASAAGEDGKARREKLKEELGLEGRKLILGIDRIDYTKGLPERFRAVDRFCEKYPEYKEKFVYFQLGEVSRIRVPRYKQLNDELNALAEEINWKHSQGSWSPVHFTRRYFDYKDIVALFSMADLCLVSPLHDGMNLVAKEYVASQNDLCGVLLLSEFAGASRQLTDAVIINPYDTECFAESIYQAFEMPPDEREKRMRKMRAVMDENNIYRWAGKVLSQLLKFEFQEV